MIQERKRAPGGGRKALPEAAKKRRVQLYVTPTLAAFLEAEDVPAGERNQAARRRKQEAAGMLLQNNIESRIL